MKPLRIASVAAAAIALAAGLYLAWGWIFPSGTLRYRLTIEVEADGKVHTGSGVTEVTFRRHGWSDSAMLGVVPTIRGEAIPVDLGSRGTFFVLLKSATDTNSASDPAYLPLAALGLQSGGLTGDKLRRLSAVSGRGAVAPGDLPLMVRFGDLNDPMSVMRVVPTDLEKSFGSGIRIIRATVETTKDRVSTGILKRLPWLPNYYSKLFDGRRIHTIEAPNRLANSLGFGAFKTPKE